MAANKELRWTLLSLFPKAPMKLIGEASKCGDFEQAVAQLRLAVPELVEEALSSKPCEAAGPAGETAAPAGAAEEDAAPQSPEARSEEPLVIDDIATADGSPVPEEEHAARAVVAEDEIFAKRDPAKDVHAPPTQTKQKHTVHTTADGWEIKCIVDPTRACQSLRTLDTPTQAASKVLQAVGTDNTAAFASICFEQMLQREQELEGEYCVFYHSYNGAALLYEVQAEIARAAFGLRGNFSPLPRIQSGMFAGVTLDGLRKSFNAMSGQDHNPEFRAVAISASPSLFAFESEAPPLSCFRGGYGCSDLSFHKLLCKILEEACDARPAQAAQTADELAKLGGRYGLRCTGYTQGKAPAICEGRFGGHMLQIFVHRSKVQELVYHSKPYGVPITQTKDMIRWLETGQPLPINGQVRILFNPEVFTNEAHGRLFHYSGDWEFLGGDVDMEGSRAAFILEMRKLLTEQNLLQKAPLIKQRLTKCPAKPGPVAEAAAAAAPAAEGPKEAAPAKKKGASRGSKHTSKHSTA